MFAWKSRSDVLVLMSQRSTENFQDVCNEISTILNKYGGEKRFIFKTQTLGNIEQFRALRRTFSTKLREVYDGWKFTDIITESRKFFLENKIIFQGSVIPIKNIIKKVMCSCLMH
jgi:KaiC/GvpD/RAD55 family RecA-like ATPase